MHPRAGRGGATLLRSIVGLMLLPAALLLSACGVGAEETDGSFNVTIAHKYGETTIDKKPTKVVALGLNDADTLLALGVKPIGVVDWFGERPYGKWPWAQPLWGDVEPTIVGERDDYNMEKIANLAPDLIVAQYSGMTEEQYKTLSDWAPVVAQPLDHADYAAPWQAMAEPIAKAVGQEDKLAELIGDIEEKFADVRAEHPEFAEKVAAVGECYEPGKFVAFSETDPKMEFMNLLGYKTSEIIEAEVPEGGNAAEFSSERLDLLEVDTLVWLTWDAAAEENIKTDEVYLELTVSKEKRDLFIPYNEPPVGAAISFNTVLSIPYAIDQMVPILTGEK